MLITASRQPAKSSPKPSHCSANGPSRTRLCSSRLLAEATTEREGNLLFHVLLVAKCLPEIRQSPIPRLWSDDARLGHWCSRAPWFVHLQTCADATDIRS